MKPKEFFRRWKQGIRTLPLYKQLESKLIGHYGAIVGIMLGFGIMIYRGLWYFSILGFFMVWLQAVEAISTYKQYCQAKKTYKLIKMEADNNEKTDSDRGIKVYP